MPDEVRPESAPHSESTVEIARCTVRVMRGGKGAPLLYLHGASGAGPWSPMMARLAEHHDVIVPEHPGFGASDTPDWLDNIHDLAHFYVDFIRAFGLEKVPLVGVSLGGWIAAEMAVRSTRHPATLTLASAAGLHVKGVEQLDPFPMTDDERLRAFFYDEKLAEYQDLAGFNTSLTKTQFGTMPDSMVRENIAAISEEIIPYFRDRLPEGTKAQAAAE